MKEQLELIFKLYSIIENKPIQSVEDVFTAIDKVEQYAQLERIKQLLSAIR